MACAFALIYVDYRIARASVSDRLLGLGQRIAPYLDDARGIEAPREFHLNGVKIFGAVGHTAHPVSNVRKFYQERYHATGEVVDGIDRVIAKKGARVPEHLNELSFGDDRQGGMLAADLGEKLTYGTLKKRMQKFISSGDVGDLFHLRYVYFEKTGDNGTRYLTLWSDEMNLSRLGGNGGDVPGTDPQDVPRFPGSVRSLVAEERGMPQRVVVYDAVGSPAIAKQFYRMHMAEKGWVEDEDFTRLSEREGRNALHFARAEGREVVVDATTHSDGNGISICVVQTR